MSELNESLDTGLSLVECTYRQLKKAILNSELPPGYQALEPELAKKLGVSRTPVREALIRLEAEKLIELIPRRGMRVLPLVAADIIEICQVLTALEGAAVELLAKQNLGRDALQPMADAVAEMRMGLLNDDEDINAWSEAEGKFQRILITLAGNHRLATVLENVRAQAHRARIITLKLRPRPSRTTDYYSEVFDAIAEGDWQEAKARHCVLRTEITQVLRDVIERYQLPHL